MLTELSIQGLAIIKNCNLQFTGGLNILTGETGAGKSVLLKALSLLQGARGDADLIRKGFEQATVVAQFEVLKEHLVNEDVLEILEDLGIQLDRKDPQILLRRTISHKGRGKAWVQDVPVTLTSLKKLMSCFLDLYSQHETLKLFRPDTHLRYIDSLLKKQDLNLVANYKDAFRTCKKHIDAVQQVVKSYENFATQQDYMQFRFSELENFLPSSEDYNELLERSRQARSVGKKQEFFTALESLLREHTKLEAKLGALVQKNRELEDSTAWKEARSLCEQLSRTVQETGAAALETENQFDIEQTEERLAAYQSYFRKFQVLDCSGLMDKYTELKRSLKALDGIEDDIRKISKDLEKDLALLQKLNTKLLQARSKAGKKVAKWITAELDELSMPGAEVEVAWTKVEGLKPFCPPLPDSCNVEDKAKLAELIEQFCKYSSEGTSKAEFLLKPNKGSEFKSLAKIASGGEASRIMLAFKKCMAIGAGACVLVFDEIDAGISGRAANSVGKKLAELARKFQIICVSHLPQVAVYSDAHIYAHKSSDRTTQTYFEVLTEAESIKEIARLLSGEDADKTAIANAKSLKKKAAQHIRESHA